jgi:hypothetical protein
MTKEALIEGLRAIDDDDVRKRVAAGDIAAAGTLDLTDEETGLLRGAAEDYPEVAGFAFDAYLTIKMTGVEGSSGTTSSEALSLNFAKLDDYLTINRKFD